MRQLGTPALLAATYRGDAAAIAAAAMEELETVLVDSLSQLERLAVSAGAAPSALGTRVHLIRCLVLHPKHKPAGH